ncbi:MAG TPA: general secretion pathway protein GspB [Paucimonas sp.]|nr:general secretion pathway protein GspB [Paucimonas sp.]HJW55652.1 general secretion pathway protein GspB [Burkholderiaceae bacterium]
MSYILDALRKAESERHLGTVPTLHTASAAAPTGSTAASWRAPWFRIALPSIVLAIAALFWVMRPWPASTVVVARPATAPDSSAIAPSVSPPISSPLSHADSVTPDAPMPAAPARVAEAAAASATLPAPSTAPPVAAATKKPAPKKAKAPAVRAKPNESIAAAQPHPQRASIPAAPEPAVPTAPPLQALPEQIRKEIPPIVISGYIYSSNRADRTMLINQRLMREGERIAPDFQLEKMTMDGAIFNYKGYRYQMPYR